MPTYPDLYTQSAFPRTDDLVFNNNGSIVSSVLTTSNNAITTNEYGSGVSFNRTASLNQEWYVRTQEYIIPVILTVSPTPLYAAVQLTATNYTQSDNSIRVNKGTAVSYTVSSTGYHTQTGTITVNSTQTQAITLVKKDYTLTVNTTPSDATVTFSTGTVSGKTVTVPYNTNVSYTVSRTGYNDVTGAVTVTSNQTVNVSMTKKNYTLSISTYPTDATVTFSTGTVSGHSVTVPYNTTVTYTVSKNGYISQSGTATVTANQTVSVKILHTRLEYFTAGTQTINVDPGNYRVYMRGGGGGGGESGTSLSVAAGVGGAGGAGYLYSGIVYVDQDSSNPNSQRSVTISVGSGGLTKANGGNGGIGGIGGNGTESTAGVGGAGGGGGKPSYIWGPGVMSGSALTYAPGGGGGGGGGGGAGTSRYARGAGGGGGGGGYLLGTAFLKTTEDIIIYKDSNGAPSITPGTETYIKIPANTILYDYLICAGNYGYDIYDPNGYAVYVMIDIYNNTFTVYGKSTFSSGTSCLISGKTQLLSGLRTISLNGRNGGNAGQGGYGNRGISGQFGYIHSPTITGVAGGDGGTGGSSSGTGGTGGYGYNGFGAAGGGGGAGGGNHGSAYGGGGGGGCPGVGSYTAPTVLTTYTHGMGGQRGEGRTNYQNSEDGYNFGTTPFDVTAQNAEVGVTGQYATRGMGGTTNTNGTAGFIILEQIA